MESTPIETINLIRPAMQPTGAEAWRGGPVQTFVSNSDSNGWRADDETGLSRPSDWPILLMNPSTDGNDDGWLANAAGQRPQPQTTAAAGAPPPAASTPAMTMAPGEASLGIVLSGAPIVNLPIKFIALLLAACGGACLFSAAVTSRCAWCWCGGGLVPGGWWHMSV